MIKLWDTLKNKTQQMLMEQENKELKEDQLTESQRRQAELEPIEGEEQDNPELFEWKEKYNKEHKLRQEAETETILVKGIGMNSPEMKAANKKIAELQSNLDRIKKENNDLYNRIAKLTDPSLRGWDYRWRRMGRVPVRTETQEHTTRKTYLPNVDHQNGGSSSGRTTH